jgi:lipopolysaccharide/colanic/teichoic acid biosynthesis glycosyltransferase
VSRQPIQATPVSDRVGASGILRPADQISPVIGVEAVVRAGDATPRDVATVAEDRLYVATKRLVDILVGTVAFVVALPIIIILAVLIKLDSPGPAIFRQRRVGLRGKTFTFYKFRTMWVDARQRYPSLYAYRYTDDEIRTMYFKVIDDPRLTRVGRHLRRTSLDELPNLLNVLKGDMSLVGPRPEIPDMLPYYTPEQLVKFSVKPGVTGLAQVSGRSLLRFQETNQADVEYVRRRSFLFDLMILVRTVKCVALRVGAF